MTKPLRIGLIMQGGQGWIGGSEYIKNIILALGCLPGSVRSTFEICLITSNPLSKALVDEVQPYIHSICKSPVILNPYTLEESDSYLPPLYKRVISKLKKKVLGSHNPKFNALLEQQKINFIYPYFTTKNTHFKSATWIYDFQHKYLPELFTELEISNRDDSFRRMAQHSSTVVVSSKAAEQDLKKFIPEASKKSKILSFKTIPSPRWYEKDPLEVQKKFHLPDRFFLVSNQFWQHKNHSVIFQALSILQEKSINPIVVCTGHLYDYRKTGYADTILQTVHTLGVSHQVHILGLIPKIDQLQLLRRSTAVLQPSLFEGWNTTVEEARVLGKPLILSDIAVHLEQSPPNSYFFNPRSPDQLAQVMADLWQSLSPGPNLDEEQRAKDNSISEIQDFATTFLDVCQS